MRATREISIQASFGTFDRRTLSRFVEPIEGSFLRLEADVPLATLLDYLEAGQPLSEFLEDFPTVTREQAVAALEQAKEALLARARPA